MVQAGVYSSVLHYLKAVEAAKTDDGTKVIARMKAMPTDDDCFGKARIRQDGHAKFYRPDLIALTPVGKSPIVHRSGLAR